MHLPFDSFSWSPLDEKGIRDVVTLMNEQLRASGDGSTRGPLILEQDRESHRSGPVFLYVRRANWRRLSFYPPGWNLYEIECAIEELPGLEGYENVAFTYAVCGPEGAADRCALIDWTVAPLSRLNKLLELDLSVLDEKVVCAYLLFFCSYLGGSPDAKGAVSPFLLPQDASWFAWEESLEDLEVLAKERHLQLFTPMTDLNGEDEFDLPVKTVAVAGQHAKDESGPKVKAASKESRRKAVEAIFAEYPQTPEEIPSGVGNQSGERAPTPEATAESESAADVAPVARYRGLVWFGDSLFSAEFEIFHRGEVAMAEDQLIASRLPVPLWEVQPGPANLRLLCRQMKREVISASKLLERVEARIDQEAQDNLEPRRGRHRLRGLRVEDKIECSLTFKDRVRLEDVQFLYDVVLDDAIFERSLELLGCRFLCRLSARDATVKGALRLDGSRLDGATDFTAATVVSGLGYKQPEPVLDFRGLKVERGLFADQLTAFGHMRCEWMRVGATMRARGLQVHPRERDVDAAFDLSHTQIDGPLDLRGDVAEQREPGGSRRTVLGLPATLVGLRAEQVNLDGIWVRGFLDLASCDIRGRLTIGLVQLQVSPRPFWWRPRIDAYLSLDRSKTGLVMINGCQVGGDLHLVELQLAGSLMAGMQERFRTRVGGDLVGSGATVRDSIELDGAQISGEILFVTGRFSRFRANVAAWAAPDPTSGRLVPALCSCEASGMLLQDVSVGASMYLLGLKLHGQNNTYSHGGMTARGIFLGGGLRFGFGPMTVDLLSKQLLSMIKVDALPENEQADALARVLAVVSEVRADINGVLDLRGISTGDTTDLGRLRTGGVVHLENSRVEGNLRTYADGDDVSCSAEGFCADIARIGGDCDLRGLEVRRGNLAARDIQVAGQMLLATEGNRRRRDASGMDPIAHALVREGCVDLEGAKAARMVLSSVNTTERRQASEMTAADIVLARGRFGQLTIIGFEAVSSLFRRSSLCFPRRINLIAVQADDWDIAPNEVLPLLQATMPHCFDGRIFVELEQRLAKIGRKKQADRVYRRMLRGSASGISKFRNRLNGVFSGNGTMPTLMFVWLLLFLLPVVWVVDNPANVEFIASDATKSALPISNGGVYDLKQHWNWIKAVGLAGSYALPFLSGARFDVVRARLVGPTCIGPDMSAAPAATVDSLKAGARNSVRCQRQLPSGLSPHDFAMIFSTIQFLLWILVAANLPAITRRRP